MTENFDFPCSDNIHTIKGMINIPASVIDQKAVILILHGMSEHIGRYAEFQQVMGNRGFVTVAYCILSGTPNPDPFIKVERLLCMAIPKIRGLKYRSRFVDRLGVGSYNNKIISPTTKFDWLTRDVEIAQQYEDDPLSGYIFSISGYCDILTMLDYVSNSKHVDQIPKDLPIYIFSGGQDPAGDFGKGVMKVYLALKKIGMQNVYLKIYKDGRHEMLNELNRNEVYEDIKVWCYDQIVKEENAL